MKLQVSAIRISFLVLFLCLNLSAQNMTNAKALSVPNPDFPDAAKESGLGGRVSVNVRLDGGGNIISVDDPTGPDWVCPTVARPDVAALREAARSAALRGKFLPAKMDGKPIASVILVVFEFPKSENNTGSAVVSFGSSRPDDGLAAENIARTNAPPPDYTGPVRTYTSVAAGSAEAAREKSAPRDYSGMTVSGGVLNGKAASLPKPPYPPAARAIRASGAVNIQVLIDTDGSIFSAEAVSGHPLLRQVSRTAACMASFSPTQLSGTPVKVSGVIVYNFVP